MALTQRKISYTLLSCCLISCQPRTELAPVVELAWHGYNYNATHKVHQSETLYAIAFRYDQDYKQLAAFNNLSAPYSLTVGQIIKLIPTIRHNIKQNKPSYLRNTHLHPLSTTSTLNQAWVWPIHGRIITNFSPTQGKKGIDLAGKKGDPVLAASTGVIAYAGSGLVGYGNLVIIKHKGQFLTAYANNLRNSVVEGQHVNKGQKIADIGVIDRRFWGVHFEIRKAGKPVNPLNYLGTRPE